MTFIIIFLSIYTFLKEDIFLNYAKNIHEIVAFGTPNDVRELIKNKKNLKVIYLCNSVLNTAVKSAVYSSHKGLPTDYALEKVKILVEAGADINSRPCKGKSMSPFEWAITLPAQMKNIEEMANKVFDDMIKEGTEMCYLPDVVSKPCKDITPQEHEKIKETLHFTYVILGKEWTSSFMNILKYLVENGADINSPNEIEGIYPIHLATTNPSEITLEPLKYLIELGANVNIQDNNGNTPLFWAWGDKSYDAVKLLKRYGANTNIKNKKGLLYNQVLAIELHGRTDKFGNIEYKNKFYEE